jgi:hypothetical protein
MFYRRMNWEEKPEPGPDVALLRKRQAELAHLQDVLDEAFAQGKVSKAFIDELARFCAKEATDLESQLGPQGPAPREKL